MAEAIWLRERSSNSSIHRLPVRAAPTSAQSPAERSRSVTPTSSIYAFVGTSESAPTTFLTAVTNTNGGFTTATGSGLLGGTGLTAGATALVLPRTDGADVAAYDPTLGGTSFASRAAALAAFNTTVNFVAQSGSGNQDADDITPDAPFLTDPQSPIAGVTFTIQSGTPPQTVAFAAGSVSVVPR